MHLINFLNKDTVIQDSNQEIIKNSLLEYKKNGNNIRITNKRIRLAKLGYVHYHTSKKYRKLLKNSKINNITVKRENGKYYAVVNITTTVEELEKTGEKIGIDLGFKKLATLSNGDEIEAPDIKKRGRND